MCPRKFRIELRSSDLRVQGGRVEESDLVHVEALFRPLGLVFRHHAVRGGLLARHVGLRQHLSRQSRLQCWFFILNFGRTGCRQFISIKVLYVEPMLWWQSCGHHACLLLR